MLQIEKAHSSCRTKEVADSDLAASRTSAKELENRETIPKHSRERNGIMGR